MVKKLRVGTRGSKLALTQTEMVCALLREAHPTLEIEIVVIKASGDWKPAQGEVRLSEQAGGKGQFVKEIEEYLINGHIDIGVHSLKDVPTIMPAGLIINHFLPRADVRDAFISHKAKSLDELPEGSVIGTSSVRRQSVILNRRPDLKVVTFRGNVDTRLEKLRAGQVDAIILAAAGLKRLGLENVISSYIEPESMLPAVGQGVIGIETREWDNGVHALLEAINHEPTRMTTIAERALVAVLDGSCGTPIGAFGTFLQGSEMRLRGFYASTDGTEMFEAEETATASTTEGAHALGLRVGRALKALVPESVLLSVAS
ncbi:MAG: hydroxymethylbilane synthase [Alphaproteobacteria bacterium]|nr:hydroxymethylbilane synthase [Alphaproteobacteria bacterium]